MERRIKIKGIRRRELSADDIALAFWLIAKRELKLKREREAKARAKRREREQ